MQNPPRGAEEQREKLHKIEGRIRSLLGLDDLTIEVPHTKGEMVLEMHGNRLPLESFGTGIHELVILCSALEICENHIVCIEEPELHLHPELQRKFLKFIGQTSNTYLITTHSNVFLEHNENVNVYHVRHNGHCTTVTHVDTTERTYQVLDDLSYKASDLLQTNGVVWVEGPSDRIYINKWLSLLSPDLMEGIHYCIMFYGGRLVSHLSMAIEPEAVAKDLIPLLKINRNAIIVMDRDRLKPSQGLSETKKRIESETKKGNCWITEGREIENYLSARALEEFLHSRFDSDITCEYDPKKKLQDWITDGGENISFDYQGNKVKFAREIADSIQEEDLDQLDLKKRMRYMVKCIREWNEPASRLSEEPSHVNEDDD